MVSLIKREVLNEFIIALKANGCAVADNKGAGTVKATDPDDGTVVLSAIAKGPHGPYICSFNDSVRITWADSKRATG